MRATYIGLRVKRKGPPVTIVTTLPRGSTTVLCRRNVNTAQIAKQGARMKSGHSIHRVQAGNGSWIGQSLPSSQPISDPTAGIPGGNGNFRGSVAATVFMMG